MGFTALGAIALCLLLALAAAQFKKLGGWKQQSKAGDLGDFVKKPAFDPAINLKYCEKAARKVEVKPEKPDFDFSKIFQRHLNFLGRSGGGTLQLGPGVFFHSKQIRMPTGTCIIGAGIDSTVIKLIADAPTFRKSGSIRTFQTSHITITDLTQDGNRASQSASSARNYGRYGFFSELSNYVYLARFRVRNNVFYGFDPHGSKLFWSYLLVMEKCEAEGNGLDGFTIDQTARATISGGFARRNDRHGFNVVTGTQLALFDKCTAVDNGERSSVGFGFVAQNNHLKGTGRVMFRRCRACNNNKGAVRLTDVHDVVVEDSVFDGKGKQVCYELDRTRKVALRRNECHGFAKSRKFKIIPDATGTRADEGGEKASAPPSAAVGVIVGMAQWLEREKGKLLGKN